MNKTFFFTFFLMFIVSIGFSQKTLSDYSYVIIPEKYEFFSENDKFQLNSLTKFLFNKYGFHAFYKSELPSNVDPCEGLYADLVKSGGIVYTKIKVSLKDCNKEEVYITHEGRSKEKEFKGAYHEALRKAFANIISLNVQQKEFKLLQYATSETKYVTVETNNVANEVVKTKILNTGLKYPSSTYSAYSYNESTYLLKKTEDGFSLYKDIVVNSETSSLPRFQNIALILITSSNKMYYMIKGDDMVEAHFDASMNLIVDYKDNKVVFKAIN